jgi:hypothetical protein
MDLALSFYLQETLLLACFLIIELVGDLPPYTKKGCLFAFFLFLKREEIAFKFNT